MKLAGHTLGTPNLSLPDALALFKRAGLDAAEIIWQNDYSAAIPEGASDSEIDSVRAMAHDLGLGIACLTPYMTGINNLDDAEAEKDIQRFMRCIHAAERLDCHRIRVYAGSFLDGEDDVRQAKWKRLVASLKRLGAVAAQAGVVLVVENHFNTMTVSAAETAALMQDVDSPGVGILYDQANLAFTHKETYPEAIALQQRWIKHVHVKDLVFVDPNKKFSASAVATVEASARAVRSRVTGEGIIPWREILAKLKSIGYDGYLSFEYEYRWHPQDLPEPAIGFRKSVETVHRLMEQVN